jgi:predicted RNA-binding Zn-ribbon protein involved in translation (DUF1610 family)
MTRRFSSEFLRSLRNEFPIARVLEVLDLPVKISDGYARFRCPRCGEFNTATRRETNLARCFRCEENFNPIDLVMLVRRLNFIDAVEFLIDLRGTGGGRPTQAPS